MDANGLTVSDCEGVELMVPPLVSPEYFILQNDSEIESDLMDTILKKVLNQPTFYSVANGLTVSVTKIFFSA
jgi:hypothetical protein